MERQVTKRRVSLYNGSGISGGVRIARELLGVREMLSEIGMAPELSMLMQVDNQAAIRQIEGEVSSRKANHIDDPVKFVCDFARRGIVRAQFVRSELMLADLLTKAINPSKLSTLRALVHLGKDCKSKPRRTVGKRHCCPKWTKLNLK